MTNPVEFTVATAGFPLDHPPPGVALLNVVVRLGHRVAVPVIGPGGAITSILLNVVQLVGSVYIIVALPPPTPVMSCIAICLADSRNRFDMYAESDSTTTGD